MCRLQVQSHLPHRRTLPLPLPPMVLMQVQQQPMEQQHRQKAAVVEVVEELTRAK